jgi:hypothetical protein
MKQIFANRFLAAMRMAVHKTDVITADMPSLKKYAERSR